MATISMYDDAGRTPAGLLMEATADAMSNIFDIAIQFPWTGVDNLAISYRAEGFEPVEPQTDTYEVSWHGITVHKVKAGIKMSRKSSINFRLDATYQIYNAFTQWKKYSSDVNTGGVSNSSQVLGSLVCLAPGSEYLATSWSYGTNDNTAPLTGEAAEIKKADLSNGSLSSLSAGVKWIYDQVKVINVGQPKFKNEPSGNFMMYKVEFIFGDVAYPFYGKPSKATE